MNVVSEATKNKKFRVSKFVQLLEGCHKFLKDYKINGLQRAISAATDLANDLQVEIELQSIKYYDT
jgi:hypothetical protein